MTEVFVGCHNYFNCENIQDSCYITNSKDIDNSSFIHDSADVAYSSDIYKSKDVTNSSQIFGSEFVVDSKRVLGANNVSNSSNIIHSNGIYVSRNIYHCENIVRSTELRDCVKITDASFCAGSSNLKNCLFCYDLHEQDFHIFNQPVDEECFALIKKQYFRMIEEELPYLQSCWPSSMLIPTMPAPHSYYHKHYSNLNDKFWRWVKTIPNYDAQILYKITLNSDLI